MPSSSTPGAATPNTIASAFGMPRSNSPAGSNRFPRRISPNQTSNTTPASSIDFDRLSLEQREQLRLQGGSMSSSQVNTPTSPIHSEASRRILASLNDGFGGSGSNSPRGSMDSVRSTSSADWPVHPNELTTIGQLDTLPIGTSVNFRARIYTQRQLSKALDFLLLRDQTHSVQGVIARHDTDLISWVQKLPPESLVQVAGTLKQPPEPIRSATQSSIEIDIEAIHLVNLAQHTPWNNYKPPETLRNRMSSRILDLRHPSNHALFRIRSLVMRKFRETLEEQGFLEINTPKLQPAATESGAAVFKVNYFGRNAFLAQSPQLAKQMSVSADFGRVFEIGPVFRAENSNTHRHLTEYTGLDIEMAIENDYHEVIAVLDDFLKSVFTAVYAMPEIEQVKKRWPSKEFKWLDETLILDFTEGIQMLRDDGRDVPMEDLSTPDEMRLGELVLEKYGTDYYVLDRFPTSARPFYTYKDPEDPNFTRSFDIFIRGQEICSGGQRIHNAQELRDNLAAAGIAEEGMEDYLTAFDLGAPPHAGAGLGLERIVAWMLEIGDVRYASLFHRDPKSLPERKPGLPHPEADTTKHLATPPQIEKLIANYGDASNTSWLDERFLIWRHETGAAIGYVKHGKFAMVTGDPLCDSSQYKDVCQSFVKFVTQDLKLVPMWMLVSFDVQKILGRDLGWRTLSCTEEQRINADKHVTSTDPAKARRVEREGVKIHEVKVDADFISRVDPEIQAWKDNRKGKQVHLTEVRPWVDQAHRRYFVAEKDGKVQCLVVLAKLSPKHGWQVKWALDFPGAVNGAIEVLIEHVFSAITGQVTFGVGASQKFKPGEHLNGIRAKFLATTYNTIVNRLGLLRKTGFRNKFGALGEDVYICYPRHGVGLRDLQQVVKFFQD